VIVRIVALTPERVELIEEKHNGMVRREVEHATKVRGRFAEVGGDDGIDSDSPESVTKLAGKCGGSGGLATSWRPVKEDALPPRNTMAVEHGPRVDLPDQLIEFGGDFG